ncbi:NADPH-dependent F420 reductase [Roseomonas sp. AR75]|uniref:NADPH-dependent F420 reductase n=1 Tax=Roseomonas sp. AR75 TaxID=2562311 RepID=UPI0010C06113|nr:NAD(P)-binding domain-containing protein [Roseomonas sp. AR75]
MRIAIIGAGNVGAALGRNWATHGHAVGFGLRDPEAERYAPLAAVGRLAAPADAAAEAEAVVLATPWQQTEAAIAALGNLAGKLVLDATNPLAMGPEGLGLAFGHSDSGGERVAAWCRGASVFKTLNTTGAEIMADPRGYAMPPVMFVVGDDAARKPDVLRLVADLGFEALDAGPLANARLLEAHAMLWIDLALKRGLGRRAAFALLRR